MQAERLLARHNHDLVVVGGGIQGVMTTLAAARRGLRVLLLERDAVGAATSGNSLGIVHGGLRYLQTGNLARHRRSAAACRELLRQFPGLITPLPCLMPLYGQGLARPSVLRAALALHDRLARRDDDILPASAVIDADAARRLAPVLPGEGLQGGALWHEAAFDDPAAIIAEALRRACDLGATVVEGVAAERLMTAASRVTGVVARHRRSGRELRLTAPLVINCAGPWTAVLARRLDSGAPWLFDTVLACNAILDQPPPAALALILKTGRGGALVVRPWRGRTAVGTAYRPWTGGPERPLADGDTIRRLLAGVAACAPALAAGPVVAVQAGLLPAAGPGLPASRDIVHDHGRAGGPRGLYSVAGVKLTTAAALAERVLARATERIEQGEYGP